MSDTIHPVILITGATGGLGRACSMEAARRGARLILLGRKPEELMRLADDIVAQGYAEPLLHAIDLAGAQAEDFAMLAELIATHAGRLDTILHLAADIGAPAPLAHVDPATWNRIMRVNLTAPFLLTRACLPLLQAAHHDRSAGKVIFTTDDNPASYLGAYAISKAALTRQATQWADEQPDLCIEVFTPPAMPTALYARIYPGHAPDGLSPVHEVAHHLLQHVC